MIYAFKFTEACRSRSSHSVNRFGSFFGYTPALHVSNPFPRLEQLASSCRSGNLLLTFHNATRGTYSVRSRPDTTLLSPERPIVSTPPQIGCAKITLFLSPAFEPLCGVSGKFRPHSGRIPPGFPWGQVRFMFRCSGCHNKIPKAGGAQTTDTYLSQSPWWPHYT